jgi:hypothetical protein
MPQEQSSPQKQTLRELLQQAAVEQDSAKLRDLVEKISAAIDRGESPGGPGS